MWKPTGRPLATLDIECFRDYYLVMFSKIVKGQKVRYKGFERYWDNPLDTRGIIQVLKQFTMVTFNGNNYDMMMLMYALTGANNRELKAASDHIIQGNLRPWQFEEHYGVTIHASIDHIDLMEVAPGQCSLKLYGGRLHTETMQDLPYEHDELIFTDVEPGFPLSSSKRREVVYRYCGNDHATTQDLYHAVVEQIRIREVMSQQYGVDLRSKSDAQIAEAVIKVEVERITGKKVWKADAREKNKAFTYETPDFVSFQTPYMRKVLRTVQDTLFVVDNGKIPMPASLESLMVEMGDSRYQFGIGGLHSTESTVAHFSDDEYDLKELDVRSYYPSIIIELKLFPKNLGQAFLEVYVPIYNERQEATGDKKAVFKIILNGSFGKFGSQWSILFAPELLIQTTITGQLCLLMLIEALEEEGIQVVSANTDGVVTRCPKYLRKTEQRIVAEWEKKTGFVMEATPYKAIYSRDVNNYIAITTSGKVKRKGAYAEPGLAKNPAANICSQAAVDFLAKGIPVEETIEWCQDIRQFVSIKKVDGGGVQGGEMLVDDWVRFDERHWVRQAWIDEGHSQVWLDNKKVKLVTKRPKPVQVQVDPTYLGKAVRFYYSTNSPGPIRRKKNGAVVGDSTGSLALMTLPQEMPMDIDYDWYISRAKRILKDVGYEEIA